MSLFVCFCLGNPTETQPLEDLSRESLGGWTGHTADSRTKHVRARHFKAYHAHMGCAHFCRVKTQSRGPPVAARSSFCGCCGKLHWHRSPGDESTSGQMQCCFSRMNGIPFEPRKAPAFHTSSASQTMKKMDWEEEDARRAGRMASMSPLQSPQKIQVPGGEPNPKP